jgi:hypothetical protein
MRHVLTVICFGSLLAIIRYTQFSYIHFLSSLLVLPTLLSVNRMRIFVSSFYILCNASFVYGKISIMSYIIKINVEILMHKILKY